MVSQQEQQQSGPGSNGNGGLLHTSSDADQSHIQDTFFLGGVGGSYHFAEERIAQRSDYKAEIVGISPVKQRLVSDKAKLRNDYLVNYIYQVLPGASCGVMAGELGSRLLLVSSILIGYLILLILCQTKLSLVQYKVSNVGYKVTNKEELTHYCSVRGKLDIYCTKKCFACSVVVRWLQRLSFQ